MSLTFSPRSRPCHPDGPVLVLADADLGHEVLIPAESDDQQQDGDQRRVDERQDRYDHIMLAAPKSAMMSTVSCFANFTSMAGLRSPGRRRTAPAASGS